MEPMPTIGGSAANIGNDVANLAPLATTWSGANNGVAVQQHVTQAYQANPSGMAKFAQFASSIGKESIHMVGSAADWAFKSTKDMAVGLAHFPVSTYHVAVDAYNQQMHGNEVNAQVAALNSITSAWKSGKISSSQFKTAMADWQTNQTKVSQSLQGDSAKAKYDGNQWASDSINAGSAVITIMTAGIGGAAVKVADTGTQAAVDYLKSDAASAVLKEGETAITKLATDPGAFSKATLGSQNFLKRAVNQVVFNGASDLTKAQMTRTAATNLLLNYPLTYNALSSSGQQVYKELQTGKYGDALKTLGENALMFVAGPVAFGWGAKEGLSSGLPGVFKSIMGRTFSQSTFLETMSKNTGDGNPMGWFNYLNGKQDAGLIKNISSVIATNTAAEGGNEERAAYRVLNGLRTAWPDLAQLSHQQAITQMDNWAKSVQLVQSDLVRGGMSQSDAAKYVVGRVSANELGSIADSATKGTDINSNLNSFHEFLHANPNSAYAHNDNFIKQVENLIQTSPDNATLHQSITDIKASFDSGNIRSSTAAEIRKLGYVPIKPVSLDAPFKEGTGTIKSTFADQAIKDTKPLSLTRDGSTPNTDFFLKASQPVPVLSHIGTMLTGMGLSPNVANQKVYDIFNQNLARNLDSEALSRLKVGGENSQQFSDRITRQLSDFMKQPKRGGVNLNGVHVRPPLTDLRQLTNKDIQSALGATSSEARQVMKGIKNSMLQVPVAVRGLGDRVMDINYKINPIAAAYSRVQGAARFAWNPIFQTKASFKSEFLSQLDTGGKFPTLAGTNWALKRVFSEHYSQLDDIGKQMEQRGFLHGGFTQEGTNDVAAGYDKLQSGHTILPGQKRSVAGVIASLADRTGLSPTEFMNQYPNESKDAVQAILHYNPKGNFINSPMARTLNMAFFPFRFNVKVAGFMARAISREPTVVQYAILKGTLQAHQFLNSPEGQAWYANNAQVIGLFKYISPVAELSTVANILSGGLHNQSVAAYGELGGLPFGFIPALLQSEGLINTQQPYVNPTTGAVATQYIPISARGQIQSAIESLLGSLYTYPGATAGLTSKATIDASVAKWFVPGGKTATDFNQVTPTNLTPEQQSFQHVVQQLHDAAPQATAQPSQPAVQQSQVPATPTPVTTPLPKKGSASTTTKKLKKAQEPITPLPGQSSIGQL